MCTACRACFALLLLVVSGTHLSASAQTPPPAAPAAGQAQSAAPPSPAQTPPGPVRRLTIEEAVQLAAENNLGLRIARVDPLLEDLTAAQVRAAWNPSLTSTLSSNRTVSPNTGFLSGATGQSTTDNRFNSDVGVTQTLPWGGSYSLGWTTTRSTTNSVFTNFSPQVRSGLSLGYTQSLLRNFRIDSTRQQLLLSDKSREIADVQLEQTLGATARSVRNAYWDLAYAIAFLQVQQQSLELAQENLRNTRARIEIGTTPPIEEIEPEAEVAQREEAVIVAEGQIATAEDALRTLVFNPTSPDFWTIRIEPTEVPEFRPTNVDSEAAVSNALTRRSDLRQSRTAMEQSEITIRYLRNQTLPEVIGNFDYSVAGVGGTQLIRASGIGGEVIGQNQRSFGAVLGDLFTSDFPTWTASLQIRYPLGQTTQQANLARARLQFTQTQTQLRQQEVQVATQVRQAARQVQTNQKRVETTRRAREFAERRLDAEQRKLAAGTSTNYFVLQAQRDLAQARNTELSAILDYQRSVVDLDTVQEIPLAGGGAVPAVR
jgi:outer membrane protein TolC